MVQQSKFEITLAQIENKKATVVFDNQEVTDILKILLPRPDLKIYSVQDEKRVVEFELNEIDQMETGRVSKIWLKKLQAVDSEKLTD